MKVSELPYRRVTREEMTEGLQRVIERVRAAQSVEEILAARARTVLLFGRFQDRFKESLPLNAFSGCGRERCGSVHPRAPRTAR